MVEFKIELKLSETTLGLKMNTQSEENLDFLKAAHRFMEITGKRFFQPWIQPKMLFRMSKYYTEFHKSKKILATLVEKVCYSGCTMHMVELDRRFEFNPFVDFHNEKRRIFFRTKYRQKTVER